MAVQQGNIFGGVIEKDALLRDKFIEPPFSILDTTSANWVRRRKQWLALGFDSKDGRLENLTISGAMGSDIDVYRNIKSANPYFKAVNGDKDKYGRKKQNATSTFDPALVELLYHWFCLNGKKIIDPFSGGCGSGIIANYLGYDFTGIEIRKEQIESNYNQAKKLIPDKLPNWICGDSNIALDTITDTFDMSLSCPPYAFLEVYSNLPGDISTMQYPEFLTAYRSIVKKTAARIKHGGYAAWVVGEVRDKKGNYLGFVPDTIQAFKDAGMLYYNEAILRNAIGTAIIRADRSMNNQKLVKIHQNVLIFRKP